MPAPYNTAKLVRRLDQLKSAFMKKNDDTRQAMEAWNQCRTSKYLFDRVSQCFEETKTKFDIVITSSEELEMNVEEAVWIKDYKDNKEEVEETHKRLVAEISGVAMEYEDACEKQEKQRKAEEVSAAGELGGGGGATAGGLRYRAEMALQPDKLSADSTGLEYRAFLQKWHSYFLASNFGSAPAEIQIAFP